MSRFYKQETGYTFTQYVTLLRLNRAKRLLTESNLSIREIVEQIGYIDTASFVRKFKACEGITPGQWRETYRV
ncbi:MAG: AraC family transcriptional regulator [Clostridiales bacterium]|nr:AraC family transcriptional regulator [Clostridiales bacterium]